MPPVGPARGGAARPPRSDRTFAAIIPAVKGTGRRCERVTEPSIGRVDAELRITEGGSRRAEVAGPLRATTSHCWHRCGCSTSCDGDADAVTRLLADLGADVLKVELPGGNPARAQLPTLDGVSIPFALHNANKRTVGSGPGRDGRPAAACSSWPARPTSSSTAACPGSRRAYGTSLRATGRPVRPSGHHVGDRLRQHAARSASWRATDPVLYAMCTALSRSGPDYRQPGAAAGGHRLGDRRRAGGVGAAGGVLQPVALRCRRLHRLLPLRRGRDWRSTRRSARRDRRPPPASRGERWRGTAPQPGPVSDLRVPRRVRPDLRDVARGSGTECGPGSASPSSSRIPASTPSPPGFRPSANSAR